MNSSLSNGNGFLDKEALLSLGQKTRRETEIPFCGHKIKAVSLTQREMRQHRRSLRDKAGDLNMDRFLRSDELLATRVFRNPDGSRMLSETDVLKNGFFDDFDSADTIGLFQRLNEFVGDYEEPDGEAALAAAKNSTETGGSDS